MIALTTKNGESAKLYADYHLDTETVYYYVICGKFRFEFTNFAPAARVYNSLSRRIEDGNFTEAFLKNLVAAARAMGYNVMGVA